jgi:hypothetical protein
MGSAQGAGQAVIDHIFGPYLTSDQDLTSYHLLTEKTL